MASRARMNLLVGSSVFTAALSIYAYSFYAMTKQDSIDSLEAKLKAEEREKGFVEYIPAPHKLEEDD